MNSKHGDTPAVTGEQIMASAHSLRSLCRTMCAKLPAYADDLMSATIEKAWVYRDTFHGGNLNGWMYTIMRNHFYSVSRHANSVHFASIDELVDRTAFEPASRDDPETDYDAARILMLVEALPEERRQAMRLTIDGERQQEIADEMRVPLGTVKSRVYRARADIAEALGSECAYA